MPFRLERARDSLEEEVGLNYFNKIFCDIDNCTAIVRIKNNPVNALSSDVLDGLKMCFEDLYENKAVKAVIITGEGKSFVAGADIKEFLQWTPKNARELSKKGQDIFSYIESFDRPVIAAINGWALGGGLELCLVCDIRIACDKAKFGLPETTLGIIPGYGGTTRLPKMINPGFAKKMIYTGEHIDAKKAMEIGLVQEVVSCDELMSSAKKLAEVINSNAPIAVSQAKKVIDETKNFTIQDGLEKELNAVEVCFNTTDKTEGIDAFINKRKADYKNY